MEPVNMTAPQRAKPIRLADAQSGTEYTLEFSRASVRFAEQIGFDVSALATKPESNISLLFYAAFRKNHPNVSRAESDKILYQELGGLNGEELNRLTDLYIQAVDALRTVEGERKNARMTLTLL